MKWYIQFITAGLYVTLISYITEKMSSELGAVIYSLPWNFILILIYLLQHKVSDHKIESFIILSGVFGIIGSILFIGSMLVASVKLGFDNDKKIQTTEIIQVVGIGFIPWFLFALILFYQKRYK